MVDAGDVRERVGRDLTPSEKSRVEAYIEDAVAEAERLVPGVSADAGRAKLFTKAVCAAVLRAARLPDALNALVPSDEISTTPTPINAQGQVYFRRDEQRDLGYKPNRALRLTPSPVRTVRRYW
ncbi:hypothetical protein CU254_14715 [Amycolatopsis sp. AA4]|uniref:hypothetical protein n=1 Tax=Actinomycetes TaxID=1760 RepID=UPI0001B54ADA|nr:MULTISPECIES: hypothetical protein [Actinomycetes]ATY11570.1 hypothetical protein CU254_14715 [Amycolatopsis sp. AA4]EFL07213.1 hypothetical protein SSMG_02884 [Streptomyces sp. AA4]